MHTGIFSFSEVIFLFSLPIFFLKQGFSISFVFSFFGVTSLGGYFFTRYILEALTKIGIKIFLSAGIFFYIIFGILLQLVAIGNMWWIPTVVVLLLQYLFYWPAYNLYFVEIIHAKTVGLQTGILNAVSTVTLMIAPVFAGALSLFLPFQIIFLIGCFIVATSVLPLFFIRTKLKMKFDMKKYEEMKSSHEIFRETRFAYFGDGFITMISYTLWPILFYLVLSRESFFELGILSTISMAISAAMMVLFGHYFDKAHRKILLRSSLLGQLVATFGRYFLVFFHPTIFIYFVQSLYSFSASVLRSTFFAYFYSYGKKTNTTYFTLHREINFSLGRFIACELFAAVSYFFPQPLQLWPLFLLGLPMLLLYAKKLKVDHHLEA
ncbi:MFS transporter [Candidatus Peregrinibacteria bacterium]|nr:MFS transporter [Candidatus Peregrinibacteria bacterium]